ncbi:hypothetical protein JCM5296_001742 [Sporobolomyces johnsonii]
MPPASSALRPAVSSRAPPSKPTRLVQPNDQQLLFKLHAVLFGERPGDLAVSTFDKLRNSAVSNLVPRLYGALDDGLDRNSAVSRIRHLVGLGQAVDPPQGVEAPHHDFDTESNPKETAKDIPLLLALPSTAR